MNMVTTHDLIEDILGEWRQRIGGDYLGYRGHVYRMYNFCLALRPCTEEEQRKLAIAACLHDIGLWSDHTVDYIPPSTAQARRYVERSPHPEWADEIVAMIDLHHKIRPVRDGASALVELFRKGDLVDFSLGVVTFGLPRRYIRDVKAAIPNHGFHRFLLAGAKDWFSRHPLSPPPFMKW